MFAVAFAGVQERWAEDRRVALALLVLTAWGALFSGYLTYLELVVIHAICVWCVANDVVIAPALALLTGLRLRS